MSCEPLAVLLFSVTQTFVNYGGLLSSQVLALDTDGFAAALFLAFLSLLLFRRVEVVPLILPDEPLEQHFLKERSGPMRILTKFFPIHDLADVLVGKAGALRLLHNLKDFPFHIR